MAGSNQWVMGTVTKHSASIENDEGVHVAGVSRHFDPGRVNPDKPFRSTDEQWQSIVDCIAAAPEMVEVLKRVVADAWGDSDRVEAMVNAVDAVLAKAEPPRTAKHTLWVTVKVEIEADTGTSDEVIRRRASESVYTSTSPGVTFKEKQVAGRRELYEE